MRKARSLAASLLFLCLPGIALSQVKTEPVGEASSSQITHVVVYPNHAQVTRAISMGAEEGENRRGDNMWRR